MNLTRIMSVALLVVVLAWQSSTYWPSQPYQYYPDSYFGPPTTGLPGTYFYPNQYANGYLWFKSYRQYTHAAYRYQGRYY